MPDLLAHALVAYTVCRLLSWRYDWLDTRYVTVGMAGAFIPDLVKIKLLVSGQQIEWLLGVPFSWEALMTAGPVLLLIMVGGLVVVRAERRRVITLLGTGAASHLATDALLKTPSGYSFPVLWPLSRYHPPTPGLYLSTNPTPTIVAATLALAVFALTKVYVPDE